MDLPEIQKAYKTAIDGYYAIDVASKGRDKTPDELKEQKRLLDVAEPLKDQIDMANKAADLKAFRDAPDGSTMTAKYTREAMPGEAAFDEDKHVTVDKKT